MEVKNNGELTRLGTFELTGTVLRVSDPCYDRDVWCCGTIEDCKPGLWETAILRQDDGECGIQITHLLGRQYQEGPEFSSIVRSLRGNNQSWKECPFEVGVDSGQAGLFDETHYQDDSVFAGMPKSVFDDYSAWYSHCCDITLSPLGAGVLPFGAVSRSGFGDGGYAAYHHVDQDGKTDAVFIVFIED